MNSIDIAEAIENGRPLEASEGRTYKRRLRNLQDLWADYSFQIVVVFIAVILLIYTIVGKCKTDRQSVGTRGIEENIVNRFGPYQGFSGTSPPLPPPAIILTS